MIDPISAFLMQRMSPYSGAAPDAPSNLSTFMTGAAPEASAAPTGSDIESIFPDGGQTFPAEPGDSTSPGPMSTEHAIYHPNAARRATYSPMAYQSAMTEEVPVEPKSGKEMEAESRDSVDTILSKLQANQEKNHQNDRALAMMNFFAKLASSDNPRIAGALGEASGAYADVAGKQALSSRKDEAELANTNIKYQEWLKEQKRMQQTVDQTGEYQRGELAAKQATLEQGKFQVTPYGQVYNTKTGEMVNNGPMGTSAPVDADGNPVTGEAYLKSIPGARALLAKKIADGDVAFPTGFALKNPIMMQGMQDALAYDPTANGQRYQNVLKFQTGKQGDQIKFLNTSVSHLDTAQQLADALDNGDTKAVNRLSNIWKTQTGQEAPTDFNTAKQLVSNEVLKAVNSSGAGGVTERANLEKQFDSAGSPKQLSGAIHTAQKLLVGQLDSVKNQYEDSTGRKDFLDKKLAPNTRKIYENYSPNSKQDGADPAISDSSVAIQHAKDAIAQGAPRAAVIKRLTDMKIPTDGL